MSDITDEMREAYKSVYGEVIRGVLDPSIKGSMMDFRNKATVAGLKAIAPLIRAQAIERCARHVEIVGGTGGAAIAASLRALKE